MKIMDQNDNGITSADEDDSFDKLDLSEIGVSTEMDMQTMTDVLAIKANGNGGQDGHSLIQLNFLIGEKFGEIKKEMDGMKREMEELKGGKGMDKNVKVLEELETANDENLKEKEEEKKEIERLKAENAEKNRAYEELKDTCEKLKAELAEKECALKQMEKNKPEIGMEKLLDQLNPINKDKMRLVFESLLRAVSDTKIYDQIEQKFDPVIKWGFINCLVQALSIHMNISLHQCDPTSNEKLRLVFESLRRAVSDSNTIKETFDLIIKLGFINCLVKALSIQDEKIQYEAAWALTNIASGNSAQTWAILDANGIEPLLKMCTSKSNKLAEQALWAISNIARDSIKCRDDVIAGGIVPVVVELGKRMNNLKGTFVCIIAWCINILCYHKPLPSNDLLVQLVQPIASLLKYDDIECKIDTCKAIDYLTSGPKENIALALDFIPDMVLFIKSASEEKLILLTLQVLENFTMAEPNILADVCKRVKQCGIFNKLVALKQHESKEIAKIADSILNKFFPNDVEKTVDEIGTKME